MEEYCTFTQSVILKNLGFDWKCDHYYWKCDNNKTLRWHYPADNMNEANDFYSAPRLWSAQKWLRDKHLFFIYITPCIWHKQNIVYDVHWIWCSDDGIKNDRINGFPTYESALSAGLDTALKLIKQK